MRVLDRYIVHMLGRYIALSMSVVLVLVALFLFVNEQGWVGAGRYGQWQALVYVLAQLPTTGLQFLPVAALLGALLAMGQLARGSELVVMRAAGISIARICGSVALAGVLLVPLAAAVGEWVAPPLAQGARVAKVMQRNDGLALSQGAAWVREGELLLRADGHGGITVFELDGTRLASVASAADARASDAGGWDLDDVAETRFAATARVQAAGGARRLETSVGAELFELAGSDPRQLSLARLWQAIDQRQAAGQEALALRFALWSGVARLVAIPLAMLLAMPLLLGFLRRAESGARATFGLVLGLLYFIAQRTVESGTLAFGLDPVLFAWLPTLLLAAAVSTLLWRARRISAV